MVIRLRPGTLTLRQISNGYVVGVAGQGRLVETFVRTGPALQDFIACHFKGGEGAGTLTVADSTVTPA